MMTGLVSKRIGKWMAALLAVAAVSVGAIAASDKPEQSSRTPKPTIVIEKGDKCVKDTAYMRKNHMTLLKHKRDETMHQGIRVKETSLQNCIDCHASKKNNSVLGSNENFCQSCHSYAAVSLDCWECHASKPKQAKPAAMPAVATGADSTGGAKQ